VKPWGDAPAELGPTVTASLAALAVIGMSGVALHLYAAWYWLNEGDYGLSAAVAFVLAAFLAAITAAAVRQRSTAMAAASAVTAGGSLLLTLMYGV